MSDAIRASSSKLSQWFQRWSYLGAIVSVALLAMANAQPSVAGVNAGMTFARVSGDPDVAGIAATSGSINGLTHDDPRGSVRYFGGYTFLKGYAEIEGGYTTIDPFFDAVGANYYHADIEAFDITALGHLPLFTIWGQKVSLYGSVGAYLWQSERSLRTPTSRTRTDTDGTDLGYGGGLQIVLFNLVLVRAEILKLDFDAFETGAGDITLGGISIGMSLN